MKPSSTNHRFVVAYRQEPRQIAGVAELWRGWVMRANDRLGDPLIESRRHWFTSLNELPDLIRTLMKAN